MKIEVKELDQLNREISVEIPADMFNEKMESEYNDLRKKANIKGFRPGKVPMNIIKSTYSDQVKAEVIDQLIKDTYPKAIQEKTLKVASYPTITTMNLNDDNVLSYTAKVEVFPKVEKIITDGLEIVNENTEVSDEEVNEYLEMIRKQHSSLTKVERPIKENDTVVLDLKKLADSKNILKEDNFPASVIDLANKFTIKEFKTELVGMKISDEKEIDVKYADDYPDGKFAGADIKYHCKIKEINERFTPELNDAFAKTTKLAETALELKIKIREDILLHKKDQVKKQQKSMIINQICEKNQIPVPQSVLKDYLDKIVEDYKKQEQDFVEEDVRNQYKSIGESTFRWNMVYHQLANEEKIEVLPSDTENLIKRFAENYKVTPEQAKESLQSSGKIADIRESILEEKILDHLMSKAKIVKAKTK